MVGGKVYHLKPLFQTLNRIYFEGKVRCRLDWGLVRVSHVRRSRQLGRYEPRHNRIVLNRVLDQPQVPLYVTASVLHHEMCHAVVPPVKKRGRVFYHSPDFRKKERAFEQYREAQIWIKKNRKFLFKAPKNHLRGLEASEQQLPLFTEE